MADVPRLPKLPSATQQALHNVTHHPFAAWCEACVLGRSRQSPHPKPDEAIEDARKIQKMEMDYAVTFTKHRHEMQAGEGEANQGGADDGDDAGQVADNKAAGEEENQLEEVDYRDQFGLTLVAAEDTTGWLLAIPVLEKGAGALKRVVEQLVRLSLQVAPGQPVLFQGNPEPAIRQIINACEACRSRLGLATEKRWVPRGSHQSNGQAEKAIQTIRTNGRTLRAFVESRVGAAIEGRRHFYPWIMRHAGFVYNRFCCEPQGRHKLRVAQCRSFRGQMVPLGEEFGSGSMKETVPISLAPVRASLKAGQSGDCRRSSSGVPRRSWACVGYRGRTLGRESGRGRRVPLLPDNATLDQFAQAAGKAAAEAIAAVTPTAPPHPGPDEAGSDPPSSSSSTSSESGERGGGGAQVPEPSRPQQGLPGATSSTGVNECRVSGNQSQADHSRDHKSNFKHRGPRYLWMCPAQVGSHERERCKVKPHQRGHAYSWTGHK